MSPGKTYTSPVYNDRGHPASLDLSCADDGAEEEYDLIVAGFGPAALAIAIALHDELEKNNSCGLYGSSRPPKVLFLEKQTQFAWHAGMLLPGAKMQISFIKDLATLRNPQSSFTFLNYLHSKNRLVQFSNLNTFLPSRIEFQDYLKWCASHFDRIVSYGEEVLRVSPLVKPAGLVDAFTITSRDVNTRALYERRARHVVVAVGGKPHLPSPFSVETPRTIHSSQFAQSCSLMLPDCNYPYRIAVIGGGQSAAEVFDNIQTHFPNSKAHLIFRARALRPSDDSPFVNEIFDPARIPAFFDQAEHTRCEINHTNKNTNYGVVRLELIERIYENLYMQRLTYDSEDQWPHRILPNATVFTATPSGPTKVSLDVGWAGASEFSAVRRQSFEYDLVVLATGYSHTLHQEILQPLMVQPTKGHSWHTQKDYRLDIANLRVSKNAGIWLQGCNEETHGLADTLLSGLAVRGGQILRGIFDPTTSDNIQGGTAVNGF